ncbi:MAG: hypothetical protein R3A79_23780 [Nannocystaceae bacterium]
MTRPTCAPRRPRRTFARASALALLVASCGRTPSADPTTAPAPALAEPVAAATPSPAPAGGEGPSPATLAELMVGSCSVDGAPGLVTFDGDLPPLGAELWLVTATGVVPGVVAARGGCGEEELAAAADPDAGIDCPQPWAEVEVEGDDELPCASGWGREWPDVLVDVPSPAVLIAVPRTRAPPRLAAHSFALHLLDARCEGPDDDASGDARVTVSDRSWPLAAAVDARLPELVGAPRRIMTLAVAGEEPLHAVAATVDDRAPKARARWALLRGGDGAELELLATREEAPPRRGLAPDHLLDHTCRTPFVAAPTPTLLLRLDGEAAPLLLTADERPGEAIRFELWAIDAGAATLRHRYPSELFSPKF